MFGEDKMKRIFSIILIILLFSSVSYGASYIPDARCPDQKASTCTYGPTIQMLLTAIGTTNPAVIEIKNTGKTITTYIIGSNANWSTYSNVIFDVSDPGAKLAHASYTLNIPNRRLGSIPHQWLTGAGAVTFSGAATDVYVVESDTPASLPASNGLVSHATLADTVTNGVYTTGAGSVFLAPTGSGSGLSGVVKTETDPVVGAITGIVKSNGAGTISAAGAGTDYLAPTGSAAGLTSFPTLNQNTSGTAAKATNLKGGNNTTLLGSLPYQSNTDTTTLLPPNTTITKKYLSQTGDGTNGAVPSWDTVTGGDVVGPSSAVDSNLAEFDTTTGKKIKDSGITHTNVSGAISASHAHNTDTGLGTLGTKNPPIDADKFIFRDSTAADALVTATGAQLKTYIGVAASFATVITDQTGFDGLATGSGEYILNAAVTVSSDMTIPAAVHLTVTKAGAITINTIKTLTMNGSYSAGLFPHITLTGTGRILWGPSSTVYVEAEWYVGADNASKINAAFAYPIQFNDGYINLIRENVRLSTEGGFAVSPNVPVGCRLDVYATQTMTGTGNWLYQHHGALVDFHGYSLNCSVTGGTCVKMGKASVYGITLVNITSASHSIVTWVSGPDFTDIDYADMLVINGIAYNMLTKDSNTQITLGVNAGAQTGSVLIAEMVAPTDQPLSSVMTSPTFSNMVLRKTGGSPSGGILQRFIVGSELHNIIAWGDYGANFALRILGNNETYIYNFKSIYGRIEVSEYHYGEVMTLDSAPTPAAFSINAIITGASSGATCQVAQVISSTVYIVNNRFGTYTDGEIISDGTNSRDTGTGYPAVSGGVSSGANVTHFFGGGVQSVPVGQSMAISCKFSSAIAWYGLEMQSLQTAYGFLGYGCSSITIETPYLEAVGDSTSNTSEIYFVGGYSNWVNNPVISDNGYNAGGSYIAFNGSSGGVRGGYLVGNGIVGRGVYVLNSDVKIDGTKFTGTYAIGPYIQSGGTLAIESSNGQYNIPQVTVNSGGNVVNRCLGGPNDGALTISSYFCGIGTTIPIGLYIP